MSDIKDEHLDADLCDEHEWAGWGMCPRCEIEQLRALLELAWGLIANANEGDWDKSHPEWKEAAIRWRDEYHKLLVHGINHATLKGNDEPEQEGKR